jgi:hypothetical protein
MKTWLVAPLTVVGLGLIESSVNAADIRYPHPTPYTASIVAIPTNLHNQPTLPPVPKFDPVAASAALGKLVTLKGVEVSYKATIDTRPFSIANSGSDDSVAQVFFEYNQVTTDAPGSGLDVTIGEFSFVDYDETFNLPQGVIKPVDPDEQTSKVVKTTTTGLGDFLVSNDGNPNNDVFNLLLSSNVFSVITGSNGSTSSTPWTTLISLEAEVTYLLTDKIDDEVTDPIPEPTSVLALGVLGLGLGVLGKKQKL